LVDYQKLLEKAVSSKFRELEEQYVEEKAKECEDLHNALADVLAAKKATIQNALFVLEILRFQLLRAKYEELVGHVVVPPGGGELSTGEAK